MEKWGNNMKNWVSIMDSTEWKFWPIHWFKMFWLQMLAFETKKDYVELPLCEHTHTHSNHLQILDVDVQSLSCVQLFVTSWTTACQVALSSTLSWSLLNFIESMMVSHHLILCHSLLRLSSIFSTSGLFQWLNSSHQVDKVLELQLQHQSI